MSVMIEVKKSPEADLEKRKPVFTEIGLIVVLSMVLVAFEWTWTDVNVNVKANDNLVQVEEEIVPITRQEDNTPPPTPEMPRALDVLNIVDDLVDIDEDFEILTSEFSEDAAVDFTQIYQPAVEDAREESDEIFRIVEQMPEFPGGEQALYKYIADNIRYPIIAEENGIYGKVYVQFVVNEKGEVTNVELFRGVDPHLDREALRVVQSMPRWKPGKQRNMYVKVAFIIPVNFVLQQR